MKIQIDIPEKLNKKLKIIKELKDFTNLQITITKCLEEYVDGQTIEFDAKENEWRLK